MAGPKTFVAYSSDDGQTYRISMPNWEVTLVGAATLASGVALPRGYIRRHRMLRGNPSGRQHKVTVADIASPAWTSAFGATAAGAAPPGSTDTSYVWEGRIGERDLIRG